MEYCRRLAARQSRHQGGRLGLGVGWKFLILEGFGPIFDPEHLPYDKEKRPLISFVLEKLEDVRGELATMERDVVTDATGRQDGRVKWVPQASGESSFSPQSNLYCTLTWIWDF